MTLLSEVDVKVVPKKIFIHCGTNYLDSYDIVTVSNKIEEFSKSLEQKFPATKVYFSTLLPRKDQLQPCVVALTDFILHHIESLKHGIVINHNNIPDTNLLRDDKHLNMSGFFIFLANIRLALFGTIPSAPRKQNARNNLPYRGPRRDNN